MIKKILRTIWKLAIGGVCTYTGMYFLTAGFETAHELALGIALLCLGIGELANAFN